MTDGICGSSCALFVEMMHHQAGVKVVAVGGRPTTGPMQGVAAGRGARSYGLGILDANIIFAQNLLASTGSPDANFLPNRTTANDIYIIDAGINLRDQVRQDDETPLHFTYEAADCRIFWTPKTIFNYAALWQYAADAIWSNSSLCVSGSTGYTTNGSQTAADDSPAPPEPSSTSAPFNMTEYLSSLSNQTPALDSSTLEDDGIGAGGGVNGRARSATFRDCSVNANGLYYCSSGYQCQNVQRCSSSATKTPTCVENCNYAPGTACGGGKCNSVQVPGKTIGNQNRYSGYCQPKAASCRANGQLITRNEGEVI